MKISIDSHQVALGEALREHVNNRLEQTTKKYFDTSIEGNVIGSKDANDFKFSISVHVGRGVFVQGHDTDADPYAAFDKALDHVAKRLKRVKSRMKQHPQRLQPSSKALKYVIFSKADQHDDHEEEHHAETTGAPAVIAEMATEIDHLSVAEAVQRLEATAMPTVLFYNRAHGGLNILYRREDGHIGWVDPHIAAQTLKQAS